MKHFDKELRHLADNGYRTTDDWASRGRELIVESAPRMTTVQRGRTLQFFTRDQTQMKPKTERVRSTPGNASVTPNDNAGPDQLA